MSLINYLDDNRAEGRMDLSSGECEDLEHAVLNSDWGKVYRYMKKKLENQSEKNNSNIKDYNSIDPHFAKPVDKIEPKFKVGDWITNGEYTWEIVETPLGYTLMSQDGNTIDDTTAYVDERFHLWTIKDAKNGDILADDYSIIIFRKIGNGTWDDVIDYHVGYNYEKIKIQSGRSHYGVAKATTFKPATKGQRGLLFQKMKEAGYNWSDKDKKIVKILSHSNYCKENCKGFQETGKCLCDGDCKDKIENDSKKN